MVSLEPSYVFPRDYIDNNRINLQHYQWVSLFGYLVHPSIPTNRADLRIADVGTGTAVWLTELASHLPNTVQLDGLDVSFEAAPLAQWLPSNVTLRHWNIKEPVPHELLGAYDIVHVRNFVFVLRDSDMPGALEHLVSLLRPGGVLQWGEGSIASFRMQTVDTTVSTSALVQMLEVAKLQDDRLNPTWVTQLPILCRDAGLTEVEVDVRDAPPHLALAMQECNLIIHELIARKTENRALMQAIRNLMPQAVAEIRQGACWAFTRWTVVARKNSQE